MTMRHFGISAPVIGIALAMAFGMVARADEGARPLVPTEPLSIAPLAEQVFQAGLGESRAAAIGAKSRLFADRMAQVYLGGQEGESWRQEVARIHDPARVSALLLAAISVRLDPVRATGPRLLAALGATGVDAGPDGQGLILAARIELAQRDELHLLVQRMRSDAAREAPVLAAIDHMIAMQDPVTPAMARAMNRQMAFAGAFAEAGGFEFPTSPEDTAADLSLQVPELQQEAALRIRLNWYAAYAPLGAAAVNRAAAIRASAEMQALHGLIERAEDDVLEKLAAETGRAAARRMKGTPL